MKTQFLKSAAALILVCALAFCLVGCDSLDYREAIDLYNAQDYEAAAEMFYALGDYEDSQALYTRCQYWIAIEMTQYGNYEEALPRFIKLGEYEDSAAWVTECTYQIAAAAFEEGDLSAAETHFLEVADYKQAPEFLRRIAWQHLFDAVAAAGTESGGSFTLQREQDGKVISVTADMSDPNRLSFFVSWDKDAGYTFHDDLTVSFTRDSLEAAFTGNSSFAMDFKGSQIGSQQTSSGTFHIGSCTAQMPLAVTVFDMQVTDNQGKTESSNNPADSLMQEDMQENFGLMMTVVPQILADAGIELTLADIGFSAM